MSRFRTPSLSLLRMAAVLVALLAALVAMPDRSGAADGPGEDTPPIVSNGVIDPSSLPYLGGSVTISADAVDDVGVTMMYADVMGSDGSGQSVQLIQSGEQTYTGMVSIGPNFTDSPMSYAVSVQASDTNGATDTVTIGEIQVDAAPQFDEPPTVWDPSVEPRELPAAGGVVTIEANASDLRGISEALAAITLPDGGSVAVPLEPISASRFSGTFTAPPNTGTTAQQYAIEIIAYDDIGQPGSVDGGIVTVAPPPAQAPGKLAVSPGSRSFGNVWLGWPTWRLVTVRNVGGPKRAAPIEGAIRTSGAPFSLPGAGADGIHFRLRPGQARIVLVQFRPVAAGPHSGSLTIVRSDGGQPGLAVRLSGRGVRWR